MDDVSELVTTPRSHGKLSGGDCGAEHTESVSPAMSLTRREICSCTQQESSHHEAEHVRKAGPGSR